MSVIEFIAKNKVDKGGNKHECDNYIKGLHCLWTYLKIGERLWPHNLSIEYEVVVLAWIEEDVGFMKRLIDSVEIWDIRETKQCYNSDMNLLFLFLYCFFLSFFLSRFKLQSQ